MKINLTNLFSVLFLSLLFVFPANGQTENKNNNQQTDRPLKINSRPRPELPRKCFEGKPNAYLKVRLKATFHSSGDITDIEIAESSGCDAFDKECIRVSKKIKFKPAIKNGELVTVTKTIEYSASIG